MINIGNKRIGKGAPCYITLEAGPTINGFDSAKKLVEISARSGADAIKFQILNADLLVADKTQLFEYKILTERLTNQTETVKEPLYDILKRRELADEEWIEVKKICDNWI